MIRWQQKIKRRDERGSTAMEDLKNWFHLTKVDYSRGTRIYENVTEIAMGKGTGSVELKLRN